MRKHKFIKYNKAIIGIKPSKMLKGEIGVFALRNLKKNKKIGDAKLLGEDNFLTKKNFQKIDKLTQKTIKKFCISTKDGYFTPTDINYISIPWHINHSCNGNIGFDPRGNYVLTKNVKAGEELCIDIGLAVSDPNFKLKCKCKSKNCRKVITGADWKKLILMKQKSKYMLPELKYLQKSLQNKKSRKK